MWHIYGINYSTIAFGKESIWSMVSLGEVYDSVVEDRVKVNNMRMYGFLKEPYKCNKNKSIYKVMIHEIPGTGVYTYYYTDRNSVFSSYDSYSDDLEAAMEEFTDELDEMGWIEIGDPLPYCQHDCLLPIRVKGRNTGQPQWGDFEILSDGQWIEYKLPEID